MASTVRVVAAEVGTDHWESALELFQMYREFYGREPLAGAEAAYLETRVADGSAGVYVALLETRVVGLLVLYPGYSSLSCRTGVILNDLYVRQDVRGRGLGKALVSFALDRARERNAGFVQLTTQKGNAQARALYRRLGFVEDEEFVNMSVGVESGA